MDTGALFCKKKNMLKIQGLHRYNKISPELIENLSVI